MKQTITERKADILNQVLWLRETNQSCWVEHNKGGYRLVLANASQTKQYWFDLPSKKSALELKNQIQALMTKMRAEIDSKKMTDPNFDCLDAY